MCFPLSLDSVNLFHNYADAAEHKAKFNTALKPEVV